MSGRKIGFIGAGKMAEALAKGIIEAEVAPARNVFASDPAAKRREIFSEIIGDNICSDNARLVEEAEVVVLSVKPGKLAVVTEEIAPMVGSDKLIVSIAPGITLTWLNEKLGTARLVRVMPNTPALVGQGASAFARGPRASDPDAELIRSMLSAVGECVEVDEELMDAVTGLSGSGPAYVYMMIEALSDGGVRMGLPRETATKLAVQTLRGAAAMVQETGLHPGALKDQVTTPAGTTISAVEALEDAGLRSALIRAVCSATERSRELGDKGK
ncbi:MAG: pyrroline-5-carboxylate reductase [Candidatus Brocadiia bacterium]